MNPDGTDDIENFNWLDQNLTSMSSSTKFQLANQHKEIGKQYFQESKQNVKKAFSHYSIALKYLILIEPNPNEPEIESLQLTLYNNLAACQFLGHNWEYVVDLCNEVLEREPRNLKALYRRGVAFMELQEYSKAQEDLSNALQLEPSNSSVKDKLRVLKEREIAYNHKVGNAMKKMFQ